MNAASQSQAAASLRDFFNRQVADAMPAAIRAQLTDATALGHWLHRATMRVQAGVFAPLDANHTAMLRSLSASTLLVLLFDQRQPDVITMAARDALLGRYLADEDMQALAVAQANIAAQRAIQALCRQRHAEQDLHRAESQSLYGSEHGVPGVAPVVLTSEQMAAVDDTMGLTC